MLLSMILGKREVKRRRRDNAMQVENMYIVKSEAEVHAYSVGPRSHLMGCSSVERRHIRPVVVSSSQLPPSLFSL
jgi:hypothetical protein